LVLNPYSLIVQIIEFLTYMGPYQKRMNSWFKKTPIKPYWSHIHWNEKEVLSTIQNKYSWENWPGIESTWRGDCYIAPFRQYLYKKLLGYNDKDVHYSKLIRDGQLTREEAINRLKSEDVLQEDIFKLCCERLNVSFDEVTKIISTNKYSLYGDVECKA
jgi:hypothetical protein